MQFSERTFTMKQGDTPVMEFVLDKLATGGNWAPAPIAGATIKFYMADQAGRIVINAGTVAIADAPTGLVQFFFTAQHTANVGTYLAEFLVTYVNTLIETFPAEGHLVIVVEPSIRPPVIP